jgi:hypothetical protein
MIASSSWPRGSPKQEGAEQDAAMQALEGPLNGDAPGPPNLAGLSARAGGGLKGVPPEEPIAISSPIFS